MPTVWCGIDWAERHHDVALVDDDGQLLIKERISDDVAGFSRLLQVLAAHAEPGPERMSVAIETAQGLLVAALRAAGVRLFPINPLAVARYRDRYGPSRSKSDAGDAVVLANILRTDLAAHRPLPADSEQAQAIRVLARAQQDAVWDRQQVANKLRSLLRQYYPVFLATFADLTTMGATAVLTLAPTPQAATALRAATVTAALRRGGRKRSVPEEANRIVAGLRAEQLRQPGPVERAMGQ
jgi:transposase